MQGLGFGVTDKTESDADGVWGVGCGVWALRSGFGIQGLEFEVTDKSGFVGVESYR